MSSNSFHLTQDSSLSFRNFTSNVWLSAQHAIVANHFDFPLNCDNDVNLQVMLGKRPQVLCLPFLFADIFLLPRLYSCLLRQQNLNERNPLSPKKKSSFCIGVEYSWTFFFSISLRILRPNMYSGHVKRSPASSQSRDGLIYLG